MCIANDNGTAATSGSSTEETELKRDGEKFARVSKRPTDFSWNEDEEPHAERRKQILAKYPQIKELYGHDPNAKFVVLLLVTIQVTTAYWAKDQSWPLFLLTAYFIGGTANHMLLLAMHEVSHNLMAKKPLHNKLIGLFANLPVGLPTCIAFKRYHMEHHRYQGEDGIDVDIQTHAEVNFFNNTFKKFFFVFFQVAFYALRPLVVNPKKPGIWEFINLACSITFDVAIYKSMGGWALFYLLLGSLLGAGMHPVAGHFIAEHYVFVEGVETYSYYGPLNIFAFNVGYHNEHHDFPFVAGKNLPKVREIASEFYDNIPDHKSWTKVIIDYIFDTNICGYSRVKRKVLSEKETQKLKSQ